VFNLRREKFQDPRVREAIALMFNFEWTNQTLFYGLYSPIDSFWENTHLEAEGLAPPEELAVLEPFRDRLPEEVFTDPPFATPTSDPDRTFDRRQARRATALLEEAGWTPGDDGMLRNEAGETLEVEFLNAGPLFDRIINPYVENLRAIGIDARMNRVDGAQMSQRQRDADFDIITDHFPMGYEPGPSLRQYFGTIGADESLFNAAGLADPVIDELLEVVIRAETRDEMEVATRALDRVLRPIASGCRNGSTTAPGSPTTTTTATRRCFRPMASGISISGGSIPRPSRRCATRACSDPRWAPISSDGCCS
jgi:microcin C transport system substrate-binding protein